MEKHEIVAEIIVDAIIGVARIILMALVMVMVIMWLQLHVTVYQRIGSGLEPVIGVDNHGVGDVTIQGDGWMVVAR